MRQEASGTRARAATVWALTLATGWLLAGPSHALLINVDIDPRDDGAHVGDDGVLSSVGGTTWNHQDLDFLSDVTTVDLLDEFGVATDVDVTFDADGSADFEPRAIEFYDGGGTGILDVKSLLATSVYNLVIYSHGTFGGNLTVSVTDASGTTLKSTSGTFSIELPGDEDEEYVLFTGLTPYDLGGGVLGLTISTSGSTRMAGLQLQELPEPSSFGLVAAGLLGLVYRARRRERAP